MSHYLYILSIILYKYLNNQMTYDKNGKQTMDRYKRSRKYFFNKLHSLGEVYNARS